MTMVRGFLVYLCLAVFCGLVWAGVVVMIVRYGWIGGAAVGAVIVAVCEVVAHPLVGDDVDGLEDPVWDKVWNDEAAA